MKVLVSGAGGFVGRYLCRSLLEAGHRVVGLTRSLRQIQLRRAACDLFPYLGEEPAERYFSWRELDITSAEAVESAVASIGPDWIFHLAAISFIPRSVSEPAETYGVNFNGTLNLLEAVRRCSPGARMIFVGSSEIYGSPRCLPVDEQHPLLPLNPYSGSKAAADLLCGTYSRCFDLDIIRMRPFNHTGPGQSDSFAIPAFARQIAEMEQGLRPRVMKVGNLETKRDFSDVRDVVRAYIAAAQRGETGEAYNVCSGNAYAMGELLQRLLAAAGMEDIRIEADPARFRSHDIGEIRGSNRLAVERLQWKPEIGVQQMLADCLQWWRWSMADLPRQDSH
ncbi:MAG: GDP-mannose 4,6-dehydratase [Acidobacteria bacterium]|nr:GDP-mannose 4,6-dehydratase [Acidobacteriota bacterium]